MVILALVEFGKHHSEQVVGQGKEDIPAEEAADAQSED